MMDALVDSTPLRSDGEQLRSRMDAEGYLFFRRLLDPRSVLEVRRLILAALRRHGWLQDGQPQDEARLGPARVRDGLRCVSPSPEYLACYHDVVRLEPFNVLPHSREIIRVVEQLVRDEVIPHATKIGRLILPNNQSHTSPPHQDHPHIQGTLETYTAWIPLGECPRALGGLALLPGTHRDGVREHRFSTGSGGMEIDTSAERGPWLTADYHPGDVLFFHSLTVHKATPNTTTDAVRISMDCRYQSKSQPISTHSFMVSGGKLDWPQVYEGWVDDASKYYWRSLELDVVDYDRSFYDQRDDEVFRLAARGAPEALNALVTIVERNPDPAKVDRARRALAELRRALAPEPPTSDPGA